jgi:hypothetical protein
LPLARAAKFTLDSASLRRCLAALCADYAQGEPDRVHLRLLQTPAFAGDLQAPHLVFADSAQACPLDPACLAFRRGAQTRWRAQTHSPLTGGAPKSCVRVCFHVWPRTPAWLPSLALKNKDDADLALVGCQNTGRAAWSLKVRRRPLGLRPAYPPLTAGVTEHQNCDRLRVSAGAALLACALDPDPTFKKKPSQPKALKRSSPLLQQLLPGAPLPKKRASPLLVLSAAARR